MNATLFDDREPILDFALRLHDLGWSISPPVPPSAKVPVLPWKQYQTERVSKQQLIEWAFEFPYWNYGVITGKLSGIICLDADNLAAEAAIARHCPPTPMLQVSGSGRGRHHIYRHPQAALVPTRKNLKVDGAEVVGFDMRGDGGLFVGPGSLHARTKRPYLEVEPWTREMLEKVPVFDSAWLGLDREPARPAPAPSESAGLSIPLTRKQECARRLLQTKPGSTAGQGRAESYCFAIASALVHGFDLTPEEAEDVMLEWGRHESNTDAQGNYYPWTRTEVRRKLEDAARKEDPVGRPRGYLLSAWALRVAEEAFEVQFQGLPCRSEVVVEQLPPQPLDEGAPVKPTNLPATATEPTTPSVTALDEAREAGRLEGDPRTAYLWRHNHANDLNVTPQERQKRARSVLEAFAMLPPTGVLPDFLTTYLPTTDCSCKLLAGAALALAATFLNRRVWVRQGDRRVYPHLWCALVAASGERKSTAVNLVASLLKRDADYSPVCLASDSTWPALAPRLGVVVQPGPDGGPDWQAARLYCQEQPPGWLKGVGTLCIDELGGWLKTLDQKVNLGLMETLTGIYESPPEVLKETKTAGCCYIWRPCLTVLAASTDVWLAENTSESLLQGGFLGRWLFFVSDGPDYKLPHCDDIDPDAEQRLLAGVGRLKGASGEVPVLTQAWDEYAAWVREAVLPERLAAFRSRLENAALKFALIFELSAGGEVVRAETMRLATRLVDWLAADLGTFVEEKLVFGRARRNIARVRQVVAAHGEIDRSQLLRLTRLTARELDDALATLIQADTVRPEPVPGQGRTGTVYKVVG